MPKRVSIPKEETPAQSVKENKMVPVASLYPHPDNFRAHPPEQIKNLVASLERYGQVRSIVCQSNTDSSYTIVAGHGVYLAALKLNYQELRADILPSDWSPEQVKGYLISDNLLSNGASDDSELLATLLQEQSDAGFDLASLGSDEETLRQMLESLGDAYVCEKEEGDGGDEFDITPEEGPTRTHVGELWQLGEHRLLVGDSTKREDVEQLMQGKTIDAVITDPPYGIDAVGADGRIGLAKKFGRIVGDMEPFEPQHLLDLADEVVLWGANHYADKLPSSSCWLVWDKRDGDRHNDFADCELAWCKSKGVVRIFSHLWMGWSRASERGIPRDHPTQKPLVVMEWAIQERTKEGDLLFDPYAGSGSTLIAGHRTKRRVLCCEIEPRYADVILARYEAETGHTATLLQRTSEVQHA